MLGKKPLIYIPKKKKIVQGSAPVPQPESLGAMVLIAQTLDYTPVWSHAWNWPWIVTISPSSTNFYMNTKRVWQFNDSMNGSVKTIPLGFDGSTTLSQSFSMTKWLPVTVSAKAGRTVSCPYAFLIPGSGNSNIYRIKDSSLSNQYNLGFLIQDTPFYGQYKWSHLVDASSKLSSIQSKISRTGITSGELLVTSRDFTSIWNNNTLLSYSSVILGNFFGSKTTVVDLDIAT